MFYKFTRRYIELPKINQISSDPYMLLGVSRQSTLPEVKREYYKLAKRYHPDLNPNDERAKHMFIAIQTAFRHLESELDPSLRDRRQNQFREYERTSQSGNSTFTSKRGSKSSEE